MKKTLLASVITGVTFAGQAFAVELYNNDNTTFSVGGHISMGVGNDADDDIKVQSLSPRININATQDIGGGFVADAKAEWSVNTLEGGDNSFSTRLGYIGVTHDTWGRAVGGTQWAPYYDVAGIADMPIAFANDFLYTNHGNLGSGRAERMVSYRKTFMFGDNFDLNVGAGWQGKNSAFNKALNTDVDYGDRGQLALSADLAGVLVGYAFSTGSVSYSDDDAMANVLSAKYGSYGDGLYVAAVYEMGQKFQGNFDSTAIEAIAAFALANSLNFSLNYESVEDDDNNETQRSEMALQVEYNFTPKFMGYAAYQIDLGDDISDDDDLYALGVRYFL
ncbi:hypothetical protein A9264_14800 [Vibrio sp. UCD-FRSSP16_10]|uniref:porin n=1 Tax=unclassified Vibrio TaxID=2614977 RepID=UPI0007FDF0B5|nr:MULTISPECIES: porin [unclassified Vibrio]OBT09501.1 hypothetical protein A9260_06685 [Vibrio sp. UCD-FRSSP16_30]OBT19543.1 hypothetical protein A9264_14800 [Vibrio sp. UCD-FRSSP16_10]